MIQNDTDGDDKTSRDEIPARARSVIANAGTSFFPEALSQEWRVSVDDGVATPALVGDKLYVFGRQRGNEVIRGLDAVTGQWPRDMPARTACGQM